MRDPLGRDRVETACDMLGRRHMALWLRVVLWTLVAVAPGGVLLMPLLARDAWRRRRGMSCGAHTTLPARDC